jgi:hypothetical protein
MKHAIGGIVAACRAACITFAVLVGLFLPYAATLCGAEPLAQSTAPRISAESSEQRAVDFLAREVPQWLTSHQCYSCHNNGDGARGLFAAVRAGLRLDASASENTLAWLQTPHRWKDNGPDQPTNDLKLARLQFAAALASAVEVGLVRDRTALLAASELLLADQIAGGAWDFPGADELGSPTTYGRPLATAQAVRVLRIADREKFARPIAAAESWLVNFNAQSVLNAAAVLWGIGKSTSAAARRQHESCLAVVRRGEAPTGGWGPYINSPTEPFDTAVVLCALAEMNPEGWTDSIRRGRAYLVRCQLPDGSWTETTRPAERESYAQRISTAGWVTTALLATRELAGPDERKLAK